MRRKREEHGEKIHRETLEKARWSEMEIDF